MKKLAARLVERLANTVQNARLTRLQDDEKRAVLTPAAFAARSLRPRPSDGSS
jgi:hypothetical protein